MTITLPDGKTLAQPRGVTVRQVAAAIGPGLAKAALAGVVGEELVDLDHVMEADAALAIVTEKSEKALGVTRHSAAHVLAAAVKNLYGPGVELGYGPPEENGFYYDFKIGHRTITPDDFPAIEAEMARIIKRDEPFERVELPFDEAVAWAERRGEGLKKEHLQGRLEGQRITLYRTGEFEDLCRGPHVKRAGKIGAVKLMSVAGAYWQGSAERGISLQRVRGIAFPSKKEMDEYLNRLEEAKRRDHRVIGKQQDLFSFHEVAPAMPFFHQKGATLYRLLCETWSRIHAEEGYQEVLTPLILNEEMWRRSGHYEHYADKMFFCEKEADGQAFAVKPMNCPGHTVIYANTRRSYRDLPIRMAELGRVHRKELTGVRHGLFRVQNFIVDDAHIFCRADQIQEEVLGVLRLIRRVYRIFGFEDLRFELSTRPEKHTGTLETWEKAEAALKQALAEAGIEHKVNPGDGAFYGPKIDLHVRDALARSWQCGTVQLDFSMPERFDLTYFDRESKPARPVMIHRAVFGSIERFLGILIEQYAGEFPAWLSPVQVKVLPITDADHGYCRDVAAKLTAEGFRVETDWRNEKVGAKIREASLEKVPYMLIIGASEAQSGQVAVRKRGEGDLGPRPFSAFLDEIRRAAAGGR
ncbi:MAG: threonine--tRNA ligase [Planctomycetes bacterium]|nr:threonine--tRNA ligase [Planctomycetota bacterium]